MSYLKGLAATIIVFLLFACNGEERSKTSVTIIRDTYGVPHIYAEDNFGLFYGYGYAVGQDRLFQMEMTKRTVLGRVSGVLGAEYIELDKTVRQGFDPADIKRQLDELSVERKQIFAGYAAGLNAWVEKIKSDPQKLMPLEFNHYGFEPSAWSAYDVVMLFAGTMAHRYADFNEELSNLAFYQDLVRQHGEEKAWTIFSATLPLYDAESPTTVPDQAQGAVTTKDRAPDYLAQLNPHINPPLPIAYGLSGELLNLKGEQKRNYLAAQFADSGVSGRAGYSSTSNIWLANQHKVTGAKAVLINGPQFGWTNPSYVYGVGLHGAGYDVVGNTMLAYPFLLFAHNNHVGWGSTAGFGDLVDIFELKLNPDNPEQYLYQGEYRDFQKREESIPVKGGEPVAATFYASRYGPVVMMDRENGVAYSKKRSWEGHEVVTGVAWVELAKAQSIEDIRSELAKMATNINFYYLDKSGDIGYTHSGKYPVRNKEQDSRLPAPGDGSMDWQSILPFEENPATLNPEQGYIANWNNRPARGWQSPDLWWRNWSKADRVDVLFDELQGRDSFDPDQLWEINDRSSFADLNIAYLLPHLEKTLSQVELNDTEAAALDQLRRWDRYWWDRDNDGMFDSAGPAIMQFWLKELLEIVFKDDIGKNYFYRFASPGYPTEAIKGAVAVSPGVKVLVRSLEGKGGYDFFNGEESGTVLGKAFGDAVAKLNKQYGGDLSAWRLAPHPLQFRPFNFRGVPQSLKDKQPELAVVMNRGSENNRFVADGEGISGVDVFAPGQSGFIAPDGTVDSHYDDQMELYNSFKHKPLPFTLEEVNQMAEEKITLNY